MTIAKLHLMRLIIIVTTLGVSVGVAEASSIDPSAKYFFTTGTVSYGFQDCGSVTFHDWDGEFSRISGGARFTGGLVSFFNQPFCISDPLLLDLTGILTINVYFQAPILDQKLDQFGQPVFDMFGQPVLIEVARQIVQQETGVIDFSAVFTGNIGGLQPTCCADGIFFPAVNKSMWVEEGRMDSFFLQMQVFSPVQLFSVIPAGGLGFVTEGTNPNAPHAVIGPEESTILALPGGPTSTVPEPATVILLLTGISAGAVRRLRRQAPPRNAKSL